MTWVEAIFVLLSLVTLGSALLVVTTSHLVHAALWLVVTLGSVAGIFLVLAAEFVAWVQVLIYVGAVVVLLLFALMLTRAPTGRAATTSTVRRALPAARGRRPRRRAARRSPWSPASATSGSTSTAPSSAPPRPPARRVFTLWVLPFEVLSVLLLAALVGAIVLSRLAGRWPGRHRDREGADAAVVAAAAWRACCSRSGCTACWRAATPCWC